MDGLLDPPEQAHGEHHRKELRRTKRKSTELGTKTPVTHNKPAFQKHTLQANTEHY